MGEAMCELINFKAINDNDSVVKNKDNNDNSDEHCVIPPPKPPRVYAYETDYFKNTVPQKPPRMICDNNKAHQMNFADLSVLTSDESRDKLTHLTKRRVMLPRNKRIPSRFINYKNTSDVMLQNKVSDDESDAVIENGRFRAQSADGQSFSLLRRKAFRRKKTLSEK